MDVRAPQAERGETRPACLSPASHSPLRTVKASLHSGCSRDEGSYLTAQACASSDSRAASGETFSTERMQEVRATRAVTYTHLCTFPFRAHIGTHGCEVFGDVVMYVLSNSNATEGVLARSGLATGGTRARVGTWVTTASTFV
jgi:hypothetical protein